MGSEDGADGEIEVEEEEVVVTQSPVEAGGCVDATGRAQREGENWKEGDCNSCQCRVSGQR